MTRQSRALAVDVKIEADHAMRKLAAFDDLLRVAEDLLRYLTTGEQTIGLPEMRAAITKAKEAQK